MRRLHLADEEDISDLGLETTRTSGRSSSGTASFARLSAVPQVIASSISPSGHTPPPTQHLSPSGAGRRSMDSSRTSITCQRQPGVAEGVQHTKSPSPLAAGITAAPAGPVENEWPCVTLMFGGAVVATTSASGQPSLVVDTLGAFTVSQLEAARLATDRCSRKLREMIALQRLEGVPTERQGRGESSQYGSESANTTCTSFDEGDDGTTVDEDDLSDDSSDDSEFSHPRRKRTKARNQSVHAKSKRSKQHDPSSTITVSRLKALLKEKGLAVSGRKSLLLARWNEATGEQPSRGKSKATSVRSRISQSQQSEDAKVSVSPRHSSESRRAEQSGGRLSASSASVAERNEITRGSSLSQADIAGQLNPEQVTTKIGFVSPRRLWDRTVAFFRASVGSNDEDRR